MAIEDLLHPYLGKYLESPGWLKASAGRSDRSIATGRWDAEGFSGWGVAVQPTRRTSDKAT